jgi:2,4-dienoyl-CoA reductase-like NADH-dependent reductase (Old Yellow Enzyme family)
MGDLDLPNRIVMAPLTRYALGRWITCAAIHCAKT